MLKTAKPLIDKAVKLYNYLWKDIWNDFRPTFSVRLIKTLNLTVRTLASPTLRSKSYGLTYNTVLAIVPLMALLIAIGKGFGLQEVVTNQVIAIFPSQKAVTETVLQFVDSYLSQTTKGVFLGIGILFLLYTIITLLGQIEYNFNTIWGIKKSRSFANKLVDYIAVCLIVPVLIICSAGFSIFMTSAAQSFFHEPVLAPVINLMLDLLPFFLVCIALTFSFYRLPNTNVKFRYAMISGLVCGVAFQVVQMLFINGQIYVAKYNAIYGSVAFLPLLLIWLQLSWLIVLSGCVITYSAQHVFGFSYTLSSQKISAAYYRKIAVTVATVVVGRYERGENPLTIGEISSRYQLPIPMVQRIVTALKDAEQLYFVDRKSRHEMGIVPSATLLESTVAGLLSTLDTLGQQEFIPDLAQRFEAVDELMNRVSATEYASAENTKIRDLAQTANL